MCSSFVMSIWWPRGSRQEEVLSAPSKHIRTAPQLSGSVLRFAGCGSQGRKVPQSVSTNEAYTSCLACACASGGSTATQTQDFTYSVMLMQGNARSWPRNGDHRLLPRLRTFILCSRTTRCAKIRVKVWCNRLPSRLSDLQTRGTWITCWDWSSRVIQTLQWCTRCCLKAPAFRGDLQLFIWARVS